MSAAGWREATIVRIAPVAAGVAPATICTERYGSAGAVVPA